MKNRKEIILLLGVIFVAGLASHSLFSKQQQNSGLVNSGTTLSPSNFSGRVTCEVPIPKVQPKKTLKKADTLQERIQEKHPKNKPITRDN